MHNALFIGWQHPVRGREQRATQVFGEWVEMLGSWKTQGRITGFTPFFLEPHGGDLNGFFAITGEPTKLAELAGSEDMRRAITRAQIVVEGIGVTRAMTGDEVGKQMTLWNQQVAELTK